MHTLFIEFKKNMRVDSEKMYQTMNMLGILLKTDKLINTRMTLKAKILGILFTFFPLLGEFSTYLCIRLLCHLS